MPIGTAALHQSHFQAETNVDFLDWSVGQLLRDAAQRQPERLALIAPRADQPPRQWTYRELLTDAERTACALLRCFKPGDRVATWAGGSVEIVLLHQFTTDCFPVAASSRPAPGTGCARRRRCTCR
ncbi:AMP-binding protein [Hydrocarboniphaga sp.]|uniref:AMP-binding protein n=1 Tax=Hydrocarboniphaga sp. TaxID=2033016 RepID=UPI003455AF03